MCPGSASKALGRFGEGGASSSTSDDVSRPESLCSGLQLIVNTSSQQSRSSSDVCRPESLCSGLQLIVNTSSQQILRVYKQLSKHNSGEFIEERTVQETSGGCWAHTTRINMAYTQPMQRSWQAKNVQQSILYFPAHIAFSGQGRSPTGLNRLCHNNVLVHDSAHTSNALAADSDQAAIC